MLVVKIDVVHLEVPERLFTGFPHVFRLPADGDPILLEEHPELGTNEYVAPELGILEQRPQESLIVSLLHSMFQPFRRIGESPKHELTHHRRPINLACIVYEQWFLIDCYTHIRCVNEVRSEFHCL